MLLALILLACPREELDDPDLDEDPGAPVAARSAPIIPEVPPVVIPQGKATVRTCSWGEAERRSIAQRGSGGAVPPPASKSAPAPAAPAAASGPSGAGGVVGGLMDDGAEADGAAASASTAKPSKREAAADRTAEAKAAAEPEEAEVAAQDARYEPPPEPQVEWGGSIYLSNDDSMSLASAQRLLWAAEQGQGWTTSQVRPHELLNYFTFDTVPVKAGEQFSVVGSARQVEGDTLAVSFAVKGVTPPRRPLDLTLVVDVSGSMWAEGRMDYVKRALHLVEGRLEKGDRVDVVQFDHRVCTPLEDFVVGRDDPGLLTRAIDNLQPDGSTNLGLGLGEGYRLAGSRDDANDKRVMLLTDALINTGDINPDTVTEISRAYEERGVRLTGVGVGKEFNDAVLDKLTEKGKGAYVYLGSEAVVDRLFGAGFDSLVQTIAHDVRFRLDLPDTLAMERFYGEESSRKPEDVQPINYYAGTSQVFLQDLKVARNLARKDEISLTILYKDAWTAQPREQVYRATVSSLLDADGHNVNKARALMAWTDLLLARSMGARTCGADLDRYVERARQVSDDVEIGYVSTLVEKQCGQQVDLVSTRGGVAYKVKLDSDIPIAEVVMECGTARQVERLSTGESVARFTVTPGKCDVVLQGVVPMRAAVQVPETGGETRCMVRGGRLQCS